MSDLTPELIDLFTLLALGLAAVGLGLPALFIRRDAGSGRGSWRRAAALTLLLGLAGAATAAADLPRFVWLPPLALATVWLVFALLRTQPFATASVSLARQISSPCGQAAAAVLAGTALLGWQTYRLSADVEEALTESDQLLAIMAAIPPLEENPELHAVTDAGHRIPLLRASASYVPEEFDVEKLFLHKQGYDVKLIQTGPGDVTHNCHGWVFAGGKGWIRGAYIDQILHDNRYQAVSRPAPGDIAIYRGADGVVSHTALVRAVGEDGQVLLESKWGKIGRFIHRDTEHAFARDSCTYYRSPRSSHVLRVAAGKL
jgi:hypothetical protein